MADLEKKYEACVVSGVEGASLYLNNYRIAGPKPWGGGQTAYEWSRVTMDDLVQAVPELRALRESHDALETELRDQVAKCSLCGGRGWFSPHCFKCEDSTFDHDDCPPDETCGRCGSARAALAKAEALQKGESISEKGD